MSAHDQRTMYGRKNPPQARSGAKSGKPAEGEQLSFGACKTCQDTGAVEVFGVRGFCGGPEFADTITRHALEDPEDE